MRILALDTSTEACSAALYQTGNIIQEYSQAERLHAQTLLPMISRLLSQAELSLSQLDAIAFSAGPGSFTGLRIAASVTQGLAIAHDLPVVPISTLMALAQKAYREFQATNILAALDARQNAIYWGAYQRDEKNYFWKTIHPESEHVLTETFIYPEGAWVGVGVGFHYLNLNSVMPVHENFFPEAQDVAQLAVLQGSGHFLSSECALPLYVRYKVTH